jgi:hypothetical protein
VTDQTGTIEQQMAIAAHELNVIVGEGLAKSMGKPDWTYFDLPNMSLEYFEQLRDIIGQDDIYFITYMNRVQDGISWHRGQVLISPTGMDNIREYRRMHTL